MYDLRVRMPLDEVVSWLAEMKAGSNAQLFEEEVRKKACYVRLREYEATSRDLLRFSPRSDPLHGVAFNGGSSRDRYEVRPVAAQVGAQMMASVGVGRDRIMHILSGWKLCRDQHPALVFEAVEVSVKPRKDVLHIEFLPQYLPASQLILPT